MRSKPIRDPKTSVAQFMDTLTGARDAAMLVGMAQKAIDDLLAVHEDANQQINALRTLEEELILVLNSTSGEQFDLANKLIDLIDARSRMIRISQRRATQAAPVRPRDEDLFEMEQINLRSVA